MLKWLRRILLFLLLGAMVNVAVAWGCVVWHSNVRRSFAHYNDPYNREMLMRVETRFGFEYITNTHVSRKWAEQLGNTSISYPGNVWWPASRSGERVRIHCAAGWPLLTLVSWQSWDSEQFDAHHWGIRWLPDRDPRLQQIDPPALPMYPMWRGFILNSFFYAIMLVGAFRIPLAGRTWLRERQSVCPACGYPRGSSPVCTECGEALSC